MMSPVAKLSNLLFAATCVREIVDTARTESQSELNALTDLMQRIKAEQGLN